MCPPGRPSTGPAAAASGRIVAGCWRACARGPAGAERARVAAHGAAARSAIAMGAGGEGEAPAGLGEQSAEHDAEREAAGAARGVDAERGEYRRSSIWAIDN